MDIKIDHTSTLPLFIQIENQLRKIITTKEYVNGKKLPNEIELAKNLGVSRSTIRQAIGKLVIDGLLIRKKSMGTYVSSKPISSKARNWLSFSQEMSVLGISVCNYELHISWVRPNEEICSFFKIDNNARVLKLERVRGSEERPFVHFISYFNPNIGLTGNEDFSIPLYEILDKNFSKIAQVSIEEITAGLANAELAEKLEYEEGEAILKRKRSVYDSNNEPLEWNIGFYRADSFVYTVESQRRF